MNLDEEGHINMVLEMSGRTDLHPLQQQVAPQYIYIEEQNAGGTFIPNLILKHKLKDQQDQDGNTLLHHMCSYNSPYLPLYIHSLQHQHTELNHKNKFGLTPLDIAALYCSKETIEMLKEKGATVSVNGTDFWAIRGANLECWSGNVPLDRKELIHWAAYNDLPSVLKEYQQQGVDVNLPDHNGTTPIDTALINKSYKSFEYLLSIGHDITNPEKLKEMDSPSMEVVYQKYRKPAKGQGIHPFLAILTLMTLQVIQKPSLAQLISCIPAVLLYLTLLLFKFEPVDSLDNQRKYHFQSKLFRRKIHYGRCHLLYLMFLAAFVVPSWIFLDVQEVTSYISALLYWVTWFVMTVTGAWLLIQLYGITRNLTYEELLESHKCEYLFTPIIVVPSNKMAVHCYSNPNDKGVATNIKEYMKLL